MAKGTRGRRRISWRPVPYPHILKDPKEKKCSKAEKKDWEDATCSICMEYPHNAVLLLCSSYDKGCRHYMCSNCLDQYKKAFAKVTSELMCPLCRGQVKGWTVVEPAREFLDAKKRNCAQDKCSFIGTYKELKKHVKAKHPSDRPLKVDPVDEQKWRRFEREQERDDLMSTIRSLMPGTVVSGDYVVERSHYDFDTDEYGYEDEYERNYDFDMFEYEDGFFSFDSSNRGNSGDFVAGDFDAFYQDNDDDNGDGNIDGRSQRDRLRFERQLRRLRLQGENRGPR